MLKSTVITKLNENKCVNIFFEDGRNGEISVLVALALVSLPKGCPQIVEGCYMYVLLDPIFPDLQSLTSVPSALPRC